MTKLGMREPVVARTVESVMPTKRIKTIPLQLPHNWLTWTVVNRKAVVNTARILPSLRSTTG